MHWVGWRAALMVADLVGQMVENMAEKRVVVKAGCLVEMKAVWWVA